SGVRSRARIGWANGRRYRIGGGIGCPHRRRVYAGLMPVCIPEDPDFAESRAEEAVWDALVAQLPDDAVLVHGQRLTDDRDDIEVDLLVLWPGLGAAVLEVKGGRVGIE